MKQVTGFTDLAPVVREQTVKAVLTIIGKLSDRTINGELLKYLAKTSNDEQPGIRTNTTICLGKIAKNLGVGTRSKVLIAAFTRSLRDPFVHARNAALLALSVTAESFSDDDCANRVLPALCPCLIDKEKLIRDQTNKTMDIYLQRVRKSAAAMPDTVLPLPTTGEAASSSTPRMSTPQPSDAGSSWAGWAISSFTNKVAAATGEIQPTSAAVTPDARLTSSRQENEPRRSTQSASALHRQAVTSPAVASTNISSSSPSYFEDANAGEDDMEAWGDMEEDAFFDAPGESISTSKAPTKSASATPFDDNGEPDFAGWLAAQQKKPAQKSLPKGLAKPAAKSNGRPIPNTRTSTTSSLGPKKTTVFPTKQVVAKKVDTAPKDAEEDADWGDGW